MAAAESQRAEDAVRLKAGGVAGCVSLDIVNIIHKLNTKAFNSWWSDYRKEVCTLFSPAMEVHSAGRAASPTPPELKVDRVFGSLRFGAEHGAVPMAEALRDALAPHGVSLQIINMAGGGDIDTAVFDGIESCDTFLVFGTAAYGEDTGNQACTYYEYKHAFSCKKRIVLLRMIPFEQEFQELQARVIFGANKLVLPWMVGAPMPPSLVDEILKAVRPAPTSPVQALAPAPAPLGSPVPPSSPSPSPRAWPAELAELVSVPTIQAFLGKLEISKLSDFGERFDLEEGHDAALLAVVEALPVKPKKNKALKGRVVRSTRDLLVRFRLSDELDADEDCVLGREDCEAAPVSKVVGSAGESLAGVFQSVSGGSKVPLNFADFFAHAVVVDGEGVPPAAAAPEPEPEPQPEPHPQPAVAPGAVGSLAALAAATGQSEATLIGLSAEHLEELMKEVGVGVLARSAIAKEAELAPYAAAVAAVATDDAAAAAAACDQLRAMTLGLDDGRPNAQFFPNPAKVALAAEAGGIEALLGALRAHAAAAAVQAAGFYVLRGFVANDRGRSDAIRGGGGVALLLGAMRAHPQHARMQRWGCDLAVNLMDSGGAAASAELLEAGLAERAVAVVQAHAESHPEVISAAADACVRLARAKNGGRDALAAAGALHVLRAAVAAVPVNFLRLSTAQAALARLEEALG